jgi:hypothetical protein
MLFSENPTKALEEMRKIAEGITEAADKKKPLKASECLTLAKKFQELDAWLAQGGDAPGPWAAEEMQY